MTKQENERLAVVETKIDNMVRDIVVLCNSGRIK